MKGRWVGFQIALWMVALCTATFGFLNFGVAEEAAPRKLTLMVYMCGSNLESQYGLASDDIEEMLTSGVNDREVSVLVMTGGSSDWRIHWGTGNNTILEIGNHKMRAVWPGSSEERDTVMNMGDAGTLAFFLQYGATNYPAEDYALILWDHGGGPLEGVCWDETCAMDHMSMAELTDALKVLNLEKPLRFIGFDACLMGSLEVANQLSPYADYMIASQETEPSSGWDYSFLKGIEADTSAAETGRRIVDVYMESQNQQDILTLSCIDLQKVDSVLREMNGYFASLGARMNLDNFLRLSGLRMNSTSFGRSVPGFRASGEDGFDLVDLEDLLDRLDEGGKASRKLKNALSECVIYSRSNEENVHGLSIYHPMTNKAKYLSEWGKGYRNLDFSRGYQRYVDSFARILTGEEFIDWNGLELTEAGRDEEGRPLFVAPLTEAQEQGFASAQLLILQRHNSSTEQKQMFKLIGSSPAYLANSQIQSVYDGNILIADFGNGEDQVPVSYLLSSDGQKLVTSAMYGLPYSAFSSSEKTTVIFELSRDQESGEPVIDQILVHDKATDTMSTRIPLIEEKYGWFKLWDHWRMVPKGEGILPEFTQWDSPENISWHAIALPVDWSFRFLEDGLPGQQLYAALQVTDVQYNTICTRPIPISDNKIVNFELSGQTVETDAYRLALTGGSFSYSEENPRMKLNLLAENLTGNEIDIKLKECRINGNRRLGNWEWITLEAGETDTFSISVDGSSLYGIPTLNSFGYEKVTVEGLSEDEEKTYPKIQFEIPGISTGEFGEARKPLAVKEQDGVNAALLDIRQDIYDYFTVKLLIENKRPETVSIWGTLGANGLLVSPLLYDELSIIPEGTSEVVSAHIYNIIDVSGDDAHLPMDGNDAMLVRILSDNVQQRHGNEALNTLTLYIQDQKGGKEPIMLTLSEPWPIHEYELVGEQSDFIIPLSSDGHSVDTARKVVAESSQYQAKVERILAGKDVVYLCLEICNMMDSPLSIRLRDPRINNRKASFSQYPSRNDSFVIPPMSTWADVVSIYASDLAEGERIGDLSMKVFSAEQATAEPFRITLLNPPDPLHELGTMIEMDQVEVIESVGPEPSAEEYTQPLLDAILLPENPASYIRWIDAGLTEQQREAFSTGTAFLLRPSGSTEGNWEVLGMQPMTKNEDGSWGALLPGFLMCPKDQPDDIAFMNILQCNGDTCEGKISRGIVFVKWETMQMYYFDELKFAVDYGKGEASFTGMIAKGEPFEHLFDFEGAYWHTEEYTYTELENGEPDALLNWPCGSQAIEHNKEMDGTPLQMMLRPITENDGVMVFFSIVDKSGKEYSLPMIPW